MSATVTPDQPPKRKQRTKTFTGCWTCRSRRVKCDEARPHCQRCRRSGWNCQGYNVRLGWSAHRRAPRRQICSSERPQGDTLSLGMLMNILTDLDEYSGDAVSQSRGPFTVFSVALPRSLDAEQPAGCEREATQLGDDGMQVNTFESTRPIAVTEQSSAMVDPLDDAPGCHGEPRPSVEAYQAGLEASGSAAMSTATNTSPESSPCLDEYCSGEPKDHFIDNPAAVITGVNPVAVRMPEIELVHHYVVFLSGSMLLIDTPDNPCRTVFMPMALQGFDAPGAASSMHLAVFHAICAASAFSLFHLRNDQRYHSLAVRHDQSALRQLRQNLRPGRRLDEPTLAAVLCCITAEAMSGRKGRWRAHVAGGLALLEKEIYTSWIRRPTVARLLQSYLSLSLLCSLRLPTQLIALLRGGPPEVGMYLELAHGVTRGLVEFLAHITDIVESRKEVSVEELDRLELRLYLSFPRVSWAARAPDAEIVQHAVNSFYYAAVIYFRRTLRNALVTDVQDLVEKAIEELEATEAGPRDRRGCAYNWASFVVGAECGRPDLQGRMLSVFDRKRRHGIGNIDQLRELVELVWRRRALTGADVQWQDLAIESDFDVMFV